MITNHIKQIQEFFIKKLKKKPSFGVTGLNPHCEVIIIQVRRIILLNQL